MEEKKESAPPALFLNLLRNVGSFGAAPSQPSLPPPSQTGASGTESQAPLSTTIEVELQEPEGIHQNDNATHSDDEDTQPMEEVY